MVTYIKTYYGNLHKNHIMVTCIKFLKKNPGSPARVALASEALHLDQAPGFQANLAESLLQDPHLPSLLPPCLPCPLASPPFRCHFVCFLSSTAPRQLPPCCRAEPTRGTQLQLPVPVPSQPFHSPPPTLEPDLLPSVWIGRLEHQSSLELLWTPAPLPEIPPLHPLVLFLGSCQGI